MAYPSYNKENRRRTFEHLPKGAYVLKILNVKDEENKSGNGRHFSIAFDIAEGEYADFYKRQYDADQREDKKWPVDAMYYLGVPDDNSMAFVKDNWDTFFADLEDSNGGVGYEIDPNTMRGKLIGGKFRIEQNEYNGTVYNHTRLRWTCVAQDVRDGKAGRMPEDKLVDAPQGRPSAPNDFVSVPDNIDEEVPFI